MERIRNFCIIAHIDHGKSTLADRFLELTHTIEKRNMKSQILDSMDLEQERGITIKLQPVRMMWKGYQLNLIDTPGHVDFQYEVSRSLAACEGAILVVDATQGIEAQTLSNLYLALDYDLEIIPVINKIDLPAAEPEKVAEEIENAIGIPREEILAISAKDGTNVEKLLDRIVEKVPSPDISGFRKKLNIEDDSETKALIFDSIYDSYKGVLAFVRVVSGSLKRNQKVSFLKTKIDIDILEVGTFTPKYKACDVLNAGEVGYVVTGLKSTREARVGDTIYSGTHKENTISLPGYKTVHPMVYAGVFCTEGSDYPMLRDALEKLSLSDSAILFEPESSIALGNGFRCGFLGLLHMDIVQERLEREYDLDLIVTAPSVQYSVKLSKNEILEISSAAELPDLSYVDSISEPIAKLEIITPKDSIGGLMDLIQKKRGVFNNVTYLNPERAVLHAEIPMANLITDFYDRLKSLSSGYASMSYEFMEMREDDLVKMDILVAEDIVPPLSQIMHKNEAQSAGAAIVKKLKEVVPRANFPIALQAAIGSRVIARETISAYRKDVTGYLYGGDVSRKNKLLKKQKKGKKRMKAMGKVNLPQEAFMSILKREE
ncbi:elongation factor 4 [Candidatus Peregrinibacteria bacterium]|nr:elongation factor 4 [Candidatus Peregrinibacteria bacterium]